MPNGNKSAEWKKKSAALDRKFLKERNERERQRNWDKLTGKVFYENLNDVYLQDVYPKNRVILNSQRCSSFKLVKDERGDY